MTPRTLRLLATSLAVAASWAVPHADAQQAAGGLFPRPFLVEHQVVVTEADGSSFTTDPVVDHYGGSMIVSLRTDGSRLIVDFARRELTEIRPETATYTVISFDRMAQLTREYRSLEGPPAATKWSDDEQDIELRVTESGPQARTASGSRGASASPSP